MQPRNSTRLRNPKNEGQLQKLRPVAPSCIKKSPAVPKPQVRRRRGPPRRRSAAAERSGAAPERGLNHEPKDPLGRKKPLPLVRDSHPGPSRCTSGSHPLVQESLPAFPRIVKRANPTERPNREDQEMNAAGAPSPLGAGDESTRGTTPVSRAPCPHTIPREPSPQVLATRRAPRPRRGQ